jgi:predicted dehydrogenase
MNVSIIGAGRKRNGIGQFIAKFFNHRGARVTSVLGTSEETSKEAARALGKYGIESTPYTDFDRMIEQERPDAVVIASPSPTHHDYLAKSVEVGVHIFCEKPFIWPGHAGTREKVEAILKTVKKKKLTLAMNSQWPFALKFYQRISGEIEMNLRNQFVIQMSPFSSGKEMIPESVPHVLSLLYCSFGEGRITELRFETPREEEMVIAFSYTGLGGNCEVLVRLVRKEDQPRDFYFGFNDRMVRRNLDLQTYQIYLEYEGRRLKIPDPLELSIQDFLGAVEKKAEPLIGCSHILNNMSLLKEIYDRYDRN